MNDPRLKELPKWKDGKGTAMGLLKQGLDEDREVINALVRRAQPGGNTGEESSSGVPQRVLVTAITAEGGIQLFVADIVMTLGQEINSEADLDGEVS